MATKPTFASLKLKVKSETKEINFNDKVIEVKQYLPAEEKNSILELAIQVCDEGTVTNTLALDMVFHVYMVIKYTNLTFTEAQKEDLFKLYDIMDTNGLIDAVVAAIPQEEYDLLYNNLNEMVDAYTNYRNSARAVFEQIQMFAPKEAAATAEAINQFDTAKMKDLLDIAGAAGLQYGA